MISRARYKLEIKKLKNRIACLCKSLSTCGGFFGPTVTGITDTFEDGDDGDTQRGGLADWFTLNQNNWFNTTDRFTDTVGTQIYADGVMLDHANRNSVTGNVFGWKMTPQTPLDQPDHLDGQPYTFAGYGDWVIPNIAELVTLAYWASTEGVGQLLDYPPLNLTRGVDYDRIWSNSRYAGNLVWQMLNNIGYTNFWGVHNSMIKREYSREDLGI